MQIKNAGKGIFERYGVNEFKQGMFCKLFSIIKRKNHPKRKGGIKPFRVIMNFAFAVMQFRFFGYDSINRGAIRMAVE